MQEITKSKSILHTLKPSIPKKGLFLVAGIVWTFAGGMLLSRGILGLMNEGHHLILEFILGGILGTIFYIFMFSKISAKHLTRISAIQFERPCLFSFFNLRSYILMSIMISGGISLRVFNLVDHQILFTFYVVMGIPLFFSAMRFYRGWWTFDKTE